MFTVTIGALGGVSQSLANSVAVIANAAADYWDRYIDTSLASIDIVIDFSALGGTTLAQGGADYYFEFSQGGFDFFEAATIIELTTGVDRNGADSDISIDIDSASLNGGEYYLGPLVDGVSVGGPGYDLWTVIVHEIGHGLGLLTFLDEGGTDRTSFDRYVAQTGGGFFFNGPDPAFGPIPLDDGIAHVADSVPSVFNASIGTNVATYLTALDVSIFGDIGAPLRRPTNGDDSLASFGAFSRNGLADGVNPSVHGLYGDDSIVGLPAADRLFGDEGNDTLSGGSGDDTLDGGSGADILFAGLGADRALGGVGDDFIRVSNGRDTVLGGGENDTLGAGAGSDLLRGEAGDDFILGSNGNDRLYAGEGRDRLVGGNGRDTLAGDAGADTLTGGGGNDRFDFAPGAGADIVTDFVAGAAGGDRILLAGFGPAMDSFAEVMAVASQQGGDVVINFGGGDLLTLSNVSLAGLDPGDFLFG